MLRLYGSFSVFALIFWFNCTKGRYSSLQLNYVHIRGGGVAKESYIHEDSFMQKISNKEYLILDLLRSSSEMYGLQMVQTSGELKRGTVYVTLDRMTDKGLVASRQDENPSPTGSKLRLYKITGNGLAAVNAEDAYRTAYAGNLAGAV